MEDVENWKGSNGQIVTFKKEVGDAEKIIFVGGSFFHIKEVYYLPFSEGKSVLEIRTEIRFQNGKRDYFLTYF